MRGGFCDNCKSPKEIAFVGRLSLCHSCFQRWDKKKKAVRDYRSA